MTSLPAEIEQAAREPQRLPTLRASAQRSGARRDAAAAPPPTPAPVPPRRGPQRNPEFSETSRLVVLRDDHEPVAGPSRLPEQGQEAPKQMPVRRDWSSLPLNDAPGWPASTPPKPSRHAAFHDSIQRDFEARSQFFQNHDRRLASPPRLVSSENTPPAFFSEAFPHINVQDAQSVHETEDPESTALPSNDAAIEPVRPPSPSPPAPRNTLTIHAVPSSASLQSLLPGPLPSAPPPPPSRSPVFATDVHVRGWQRIGSYARGYVVFDVYVKAKSGHSLPSHKRYNSFAALAERLCTEVPEHAEHLPPLPPRHKGILHKYLPSFLEQRRRALQHWLSATLLDPRWGGTRAYREWVLER